MENEAGLTKRDPPDLKVPVDYFDYQDRLLMQKRAWQTGRNQLHDVERGRLYICHYGAGEERHERPLTLEELCGHILTENAVFYTYRRGRNRPGGKYRMDAVDWRSSLAYGGMALGEEFAKMLEVVSVERYAGFQLARREEYLNG